MLDLNVSFIFPTKVPATPASHPPGNEEAADEERGSDSEEGTKTIRLD